MTNRYGYQTHVTWADTDASGRIHFTAAMRWAECAEHEFLAESGFNFGGSFPRVSVAVDYRAPLRFRDVVDIELAATRVGRTSITYTWNVTHDGKVHASGHHTVVYVPNGDSPAEIPQELRNALKLIHEQA